jgi:hypothetical protein
LIILGRLKTRLGQYSLARRDLDQAARLMQQSNNYQYWGMLELDELQLEIELEGNHDRARALPTISTEVTAASSPYAEVQRLNGSASALLRATRLRGCAIAPRPQPRDERPARPPAQ